MNKAGLLLSAVTFLSLGITTASAAQQSTRNSALKCKSPSLRQLGYDWTAYGEAVDAYGKCVDEAVAADRKQEELEAQRREIEANTKKLASRIIKSQSTEAVKNAVKGQVNTRLGVKVFKETAGPGARAVSELLGAERAAGEKVIPHSLGMDQQPTDPALAIAERAAKAGYSRGADPLRKQIGETSTVGAVRTADGALGQLNSASDGWSHSSPPVGQASSSSNWARTQSLGAGQDASFDALTAETAHVAEVRRTEHIRQAKEARMARAAIARRASASRPRNAGSYGQKAPRASNPYISPSSSSRSSAMSPLPTSNSDKSECPQNFLLPNGECAINGLAQGTGKAVQ